MTSGTFVLRFASLPMGHSAHQGRLEFEVLDAAEEPESIVLDARAEVDRAAARVYVRGRAEGHAESTCHRCLRRFQRAVGAAFDLTLVWGGTVESDENFVSIPENDVEYDLAPHVREAVLLEEPIALLCDPECRGLCSRCGADLNSGPCGCKPDGDPRWAPLEDLRRRL